MRRLESHRMNCLLAEEAPRDPSLLHVYLGSLGHRQSCLLTPQRLQKDVYQFMTEEQQVARKKYVSLLASDLENVDLLHIRQLKWWVRGARWQPARPGEKVSKACAEHFAV